KDWGPDEIRGLRGELTRAAFAESLGVTPLTIYRWELPDEAPEARRPRGALLERLRRMAAGSEPMPAATQPVPPTLPAPAPPEPPDGSPSFEEEQAQVLPVLDAVQTGDWRRAESELLSLLMARRLVSPAARALAAVGLAHVHLGYRGDPRGAFSALH